MLDFNSLYNAVFNPQYPEFDAQTDYYTVIFDTPEFKHLYPEISSKLNTMMSSDSYVYYHSETYDDLSENCIDNHLSDVSEFLDMRIQGDPPARRYCLISYFDNGNHNTDCIFDVLSNIKREPKDIVTLMVCMPKQMSEQKKFLRDLAFQLLEKAPYVDWYIFCDMNTSYYRRLLGYSICGVIINNSNLAMQKRRKYRKNAANNTVVNYIDTQLGEEGKQYISKLPEISWSTVCYKYYDRQYDFLSKYVLDTCKNLKQITPQYFVGLIDSIYRSLVPAKDPAMVRDLLNSAVEFMPYVTPSVPKNAVNTLSDLFYVAYGENGYSAVELSLKATLTSLYSYNIDTLVRECCRKIFEECSKFAESGIYETVCQMIIDKVEAVRVSAKGITSNIKLILNEDIVYGSHSDLLNKFLDKYNLYYTNQKEELFWSEVLRIITSHPEDYDEYCNNASRYYNEIGELTKVLPVINAYNNGSVEIIELAAAEILSMDKNEELCEHIRSQFEHLKQDGAGKNSPQDCSAVLNIEFDPHFYESCKVEYHNDAYELCGLEINGKYLAYIGGENNV